MTRTPSDLDATGINDVAQLLSRVVDVELSPRQAEDLIDEMSKLLWAISNLDPSYDGSWVMGRIRRRCLSASEGSRHRP